MLSFIWRNIEVRLEQELFICDDVEDLNWVLDVSPILKVSLSPEACAIRFVASETVKCSRRDFTFLVGGMQANLIQGNFLDIAIQVLARLLLEINDPRLCFHFHTITSSYDVERMRWFISCETEGINARDTSDLQRFPNVFGEDESFNSLSNLFGTFFAQVRNSSEHIYKLLIKLESCKWVSRLLHGSKLLPVIFVSGNNFFTCLPCGILFLFDLMNYIKLLENLIEFERVNSVWDVSDTIFTWDTSNHQEFAVRRLVLYSQSDWLMLHQWFR